MNISLKKHELGFLQVDPLPSSFELNEYYSKKYYQESTSSTYQQEYSEEELKYINNKIAQKAYIIDQQLKGKAGSFLDVGCGEGFAMNFYNNKSWEVHGIDFSEYGILKFNPEVINNFEKGDIYTSIENKISCQEKYDIVWVGNVLEHVLDPLNMLGRLKLLLSMDGVMVITVPNDGSAYQQLLLDNKYVDRQWWIAYPDHLSYFNYQSLINTTSNAGLHCFELISDFPIDFYLLHSGSNYISQPKMGKEAHRARVTMENFISNNSMKSINSFYNNLAQLGLGRDLTIFLSHNQVSQ